MLTIHVALAWLLGALLFIGGFMISGFFRGGVWDDDPKSDESHAETRYKDGA